MFCSRLNENSRQAKVSKLSLVLWLNENVRFRGEYSRPCVWQTFRYIKNGTSGVVSYTQSLVYGEAMASEDISCAPEPYGPRYQKPQ